MEHSWTNKETQLIYNLFFKELSKSFYDKLDECMSPTLVSYKESIDNAGTFLYQTVMDSTLSKIDLPKILADIISYIIFKTDFNEIARFLLNH